MSRYAHHERRLLGDRESRERARAPKAREAGEVTKREFARLQQEVDRLDAQKNRLDNQQARIVDLEARVDALEGG